jgi:3-isopropylmalate/(R)-2-methylmalate dehydratase large subunit
MGMTITEKILAKASGKQSVKPGEIVTVAVDWRMTNDATTHITIDMYENLIKNKRIADPRKTVFIIDHNVPAECVETATVQNKMRKFAREHGIILHDGEGVCHQIMLESHVNPGEVVIAADSHTCAMGAVGAFGTGVGSTDLLGAMVTGQIWLMVPETLRFNLANSLGVGVYARDLILKIIGDIKADGATYMAMEFGGPAKESLTIDDRIALCNMGVEAGAKNAIIEPDEVVRDFLREMARPLNDPVSYLASDADCGYKAVFGYDLSAIEPAVVSPHSVDNYDTATNKEKEKIRIDQGFIGSCNNGRIEELRVAARILKGKKVDTRCKLIISPASRRVYLQALQEGLIGQFLESGAIIMNPNCSVCWGGCQGVLGAGETLISTGTRNFKGRAGSKDSFVYLGSAATVAASSVAGKIVDPRNYLQG